MSFKNKSTKITAVLLACAAFTGMFSHVQISAKPYSYALKKNESFLENHSGIKKVLKFLCISAGVAAGGAGIYCGVKQVLDVLNPERAEIRKNADLAKARLPKLRKELMQKDTLPARKMELRQDISDCNDAIALKESQGNSLRDIAGVSGVIALAKFGFDSIDTIGSLSKKVLSISCLKIASDQIKLTFSGIKSWLDAPAKEFSKEEAFANFDKAFEDLEGQEEVENVVKSYLYDIVIGRNQAKWKNEKYSHGDVLYFHGPSGVGKSFVSQRIPYILYSNPKVFVVSASDVDKEKKESIVSQLFNSSKSKSINPYFPVSEKTKGLVDYLKDNPNGIVRIEEYDKICTPALDEVFRTITECGTINVDGEKIDCSGTIFILTSNEDNVSMEGFEKSDSRKLDKESIREGYTRVWHDKSFLNRVKKVEFKNLTAKAYIPIIKKHFDELAKYWSDSENAGITLVLKNETIEALANRIENLKQGARPIDIMILPALQMQIGNKIKLAPHLDFYRNKTLYISYDLKNQVFEVNDCEN